MSDIEQKIKGNVWETNLDETVDAIKALSSEAAKWTWVRNMSCKYVSIRVDMRDGAFVLQDRNGVRISLDALKWQYSDASKEMPA